MYENMLEAVNILFFSTSFKADSKDSLHLSMDQHLVPKPVNWLSRGNDRKFRSSVEVGPDIPKMLEDV